MSFTDAYLEELQPLPQPATGSTHPILDEALDKLALVVAALRRAGPHYARRSEAFRIFAAGSWHRHVYMWKVEEAAKLLPMRLSVQHDVVFADNTIEEVIALLRKEGLEDDARDLAESRAVYQHGASWFLEDAEY